MQRIMVIGVSAGAGKSTFAKEIGKNLAIPVYHLDRFFWEPGWIEADKQEFIDRIREVVKKERWIIEGNYFSTFEERAAFADTIIYLELPLYVCLYRVFKRRFQYRGGQTRPDLPEGCPEKIDAAFLHYILSTYSRRKKQVGLLLFDWQQEDPSRMVIKLRNQKEITNYLRRKSYEKSNFPGS